jgi:pimeloyl-ACP methyl ester carboxylesterase
VWHQPPRQVLGALLLEAGRPVDAEQIYLEDLKRFRENGWSLFGLMRSLEAQHRTSDAAGVRRRFEKAWARADVTLTSSRMMTARGAMARPAAPAQPEHGSHSGAARIERHIDLATGTTLAYVESGDPRGTPVVLLHGYTDSWRSFERVLPLLPTSLRVFAITQRGHGNSQKPHHGYEPGAFAADVAAFLDAFGLERAVIVGHSMGATVGQRFAIDYPRRIKALVLEGAFLPSPARGEVEKFWAEDFQQSTLARPVPPEFFETVVGESLKVPARVWQAALRPYLTTDFVHELEKILAPTLLVWGDRDAFALRADQEALANAIAGSQLVVYAGAGHSPHWEEPQRFAEQVVSFLAGVAQRSQLR